MNDTLELHNHWMELTLNPIYAFVLTISLGYIEYAIKASAYDLIYISWPLLTRGPTFSLWKSLVALLFHAAELCCTYVDVTGTIVVYCLGLK